MLATKSPKPSTRSRRQALLAGAAIALAMTAMARAPRAYAQAFQGAPNVVSGSVGIVAEGNGTLLTVNTPQAVINWAPNDTGIGGGPINFLPSGSTATYQNSTNITDFTVLNRIIPTDQTRGVQFNGTVQSRISVAGGPTQPGGSVWFFSPGGVIAGSGAIFDVGSLVLTTNDISFANGLFGDGPNSSRGTIQFRGPANSTAAVEVQAGAQILANNQSGSNAYVALVAPRVVQRGSINTRGSSALIAAEQADLMINFGNLFDINILVGTTAGTAIDHSGVTGGPSGGFSVNNTVYLATVAKNSAVTMLVGGALGYTPATTATVDNFGAVILSAGYDISQRAIASGPDNANSANITIRPGTFTSNVVAHASGVLTGTAASESSINFGGDADLIGDSAATLIANGGSITVGDDLTLTAGRGRSGGNAGLNASNGSVTIGGDLVIDASAQGADDLTPGTGVGEDAEAGSAGLFVTSSTVTVGGSAQVLADATPGVGTLRSGSSRGGLASVTVNGTLTIGDPQNPNNGDLFVSASGFGADRVGFFNLALNGGAGVGGGAEVRFNGGTLTASDVFVNADGSGGRGGSSGGTAVAGGTAGSATGGAASFTALGTANIVSLSMSAFAQAGNVSFLSAGADASGGAVTVDANGGAINVASFMSLDASAFSSGGVTAGEANGGDVTLIAQNEGSLTTTSIGLNASAFADFGETLGGDAFAGSITMRADLAGTLTLGNFSATADANAGSGEQAGEAIGGTITVSSLTNGTLSAVFGGSISADASGGDGNQGGDGNGGIVTVVANDGAMVLGDPGNNQFFFISANGTAGQSFDGEPTNGSGGIVDISVGGGGSLSFDFLDVSADGAVGGEGFFALQAPEPSPGSGGIGSGGEVSFTSDGGTTIGNALNLRANGFGGAAGSSGPAGDGVGGIVSFALTGGSVTLDGVNLEASGQGGEGFFGDIERPATDGGNGIGGTATFSLEGGDLTTQSLFASARGEGGRGGFGNDVDAADGGGGFGGTAKLTLDGAEVEAEFIQLFAEGEGGQGGVAVYDTGGEGGADCQDCTFDDFGGDGGLGHGGSTQIDLLSGTLTNNFMLADATGIGGQGGASFSFFFGGNASGDPDGGGGDGGMGQGGATLVQVRSPDLELGSVIVQSVGVGGEAGFGSSGGGGGDAEGGFAIMIADNVGLGIGSLAVQAYAEAGSGQDSFVVAGGDGGDATGGTATIRAQGEDALLTIGSLSLDVQAFAGSGGDGVAGEGFAPDEGADGGFGGNGTGGTGEIVADLGAIVFENGYGQGSVFFDASGFGGSGGDGGDGAATGLSGGVGGNGGFGVGGVVRMDALGGTVTSQQMQMRADGIGGEGAFGGIGAFDPGDPMADPPIPPSGPFQSPNGVTGDSAGGLVRLFVEDNSEVDAVGGISLGETTLSASAFAGSFFGGSEVAGTIEIVDSGADEDGSIRFSTLFAEASGASATVGSGISIFSQEGPIQVANFASLSTSGNVTIEAIGTGGVASTGSFFVEADGGVTITHADRPADMSTVGAFFLGFDANGPITADPGTQLMGVDNLSLFSFGSSVTAARLLSDNRITVQAFGDARIGDAIASGGVACECNPRIEILAGFNGFSESGQNFVPADAIITGMVSADEVDVRAGRDIVVEEGGSLTAGSLLQIYATRDIVGLGSLIAEDTLNIGVGEDLSIGTIDVANELNTIDIDGFITDFGRLVVPGALDVADLLILRNGDLDVEAAQISIGRAESSANLLLNSSGRVDLGSALADGSIGVFAENAVDIGTAEAGRGGEFGNLTIFSNATESDYTIRVGEARALGDILITGLAPNQGAGLDAGLLDAGGSIFAQVSGDAAIENAISAGVGQGEGIAGIHVNAGGDAMIERAEAAEAIFVNAGENLTAGTLIAASIIDLNAGDDATVGSARAGGGSGQSEMFVVQANANSAFGGTPLDSLVVEQGQTITVMSSTNDLWSAGGLPRTSDGDGLVAARFATANDDSGFAPGTQIGADFGLFNSGSFSAPFGALVGEVGGQRVLLGANGEVIAPASGTLRLTYWDSNAADNVGSINFALSTGTPPPLGSGAVFINAGGNLNVGSAVAGGEIDLNAGANTTVGMASAGFDIDINAGSATSVMIARSSDGDIFLNAGSGLTLGSAIADETVDVNAGSSLTIGTIEAGDDIFLSAGSSITADSLTAGYEIDVFASTDVTIGSATTLGLIGNGGFDDNDIDIFAGGDIRLDDADSAGSIFLDAGDDITAGNLVADEEIDVEAGGGISIASARTTGLGSEQGYGGECGYGECGYGNGGEGFFNDISMFALGSIEIGTADSAGNIGIEAGGEVDADTLIARGLDDSDDDLEGAIGVGAEGNVRVGSATATRDIGLASLFGNTTAGTLDAASDAVVLAGGDINLGDVTAGGVIYLGSPVLIPILVGGEGFGGFDEFADIDVDSDTLRGIPPLPAGGSIDATGLLVGSDLIAGAEGGISLARTDIDQDATLFAGGGIVASTDLGVGGIVRATGADIDFTSLGALTIDAATATNGDIRVNTAQDLRVDEMRSAGDIRLTSTAASVLLGDVTTQPDVGGEGFQSESRIGGLAVGEPGPGDIFIDAALDIVAQGDVDARRNLNMGAGRFIDVDSLIHGIAIDLSSADIGIDDEGGQIGRSTTTTSIQFANRVPGSQTFIGGADSGSAGYRLSGAEVGRVFSNGDITIFAPGGGSTGGSTPDVVLGTMTVNGQTGSGERAGQMGNGGRFRVDTPGRLAIVGDVDFVGLGDTARVDLDADQQISLAAETGSLSIRGAGNALAGELLLSSNMIVAGTADAISDVAAATSTDAINDRLGQAEGTANDDGFFAARGMRVQASNGFFIQNSGASGGATPADRRGFTVGEGGLRVTTGGSSTRIVINGRQRNADGTFATGVDLIGRVQINTGESSSAQFDPRSTINGCLITAGAQCGQGEPPPPPPPIVNPTVSVRDIPLLTEEQTSAVGGDTGEGSAFPTALVTFADFESFGFEPLIDEPVTGAGNDDLWLAPDEEEEDDEASCTDAAGNPVPCTR